ncbi:fibrillin-1-like [Anneissia japonica]|uniref:fibrillin-1-like n=1 Tax=Anneissia japonica TaxID=1529436 RepID=UPI0014256D2D|nr:fibrillin-1-like [Anneissia japonica]
MKVVWCLLFLILAITMEATPTHRKRPENPTDFNKGGEADVIYTKQQLESIKNSGRNKRSTATIPLWPDGNVVYEIVDIGTDLENLVRQAIYEWSEATCLVFEEFDGNDANQSRIQFVSSDNHCLSYVGYTGGIQSIWLASSYCSHIGVVLHEIAHAIGLLHEHTRSDRNDYVTINVDNIQDGMETNFELRTFVTDTEVPYNLGSIMHYGPYTFSQVPNNRDYLTIEPHDLEQLTAMGSQSKLSHLDSLYVNKLYSCNEDCTDAQLSQNCKNGGFVGKNCACVCPNGIVGDLCQSVASSITSSECASVSGQVAPEGATVSLTFETFNIEDDSYCFWDQLYIRYNGAYFDTGPYYCGTSLEGITITSSGNVILLDFNSDDWWTEPGFRAEYYFVDDDECDLQTHECDANAQCENTIGSYDCTCNEGYSGDGFECTDINECDQTNQCDTNAECANTAGSYDCTCNDGYEGDGSQCTDINECDQTNQCDTNAECANTAGSYDCTCNDGYEGDGSQCTDINECDQTNQCDTNAECANTAGSYDCTCNDGYEGDGSQCTDINECDQTNQCDTNAECANTAGSYDCTCNDGYEGDGSQCTDINECDQTNQCDTNAECANTAGSYDCTCNDGYEGDGSQCTVVVTTVTVEPATPNQLSIAAIGGCSSSSEQVYGRITSENYPGGYNPYSSCQWTIDTWKDMTWEDMKNIKNNKRIQYKCIYLLRQLSGANLNKFMDSIDYE